MQFTLSIKAIPQRPSHIMQQTAMPETMADASSPLDHLKGLIQSAALQVMSFPTPPTAAVMDSLVHQLLLLPLLPRDFDGEIGTGGTFLGLTSTRATTPPATPPDTDWIVLAFRQVLLEALSKEASDVTVKGVSNQQSLFAILDLAIHISSPSTVSASLNRWCQSGGNRSISTGSTKADIKGDKDTSGIGSLADHFGQEEPSTPTPIPTDNVDQANTSITPHDRPIDPAIHDSIINRLDPTLPFVLIEDVLDILTTASASSFFSFLETRFLALSEGFDPSRGKSLTLLRTCNNLLKRLSKSRGCVLSGRILVLLAKIFPIDNRSGVNLKGDFNVDNVTTWDADRPSGLVSEGMDEGDEMSAPTVPSDSFSLYQQFWRLQNQFLQLPFNQLGGVLEDLTKVVDLLESHRPATSVTAASGSAASSTHDATSTTLSATSKKGDFFPKYLTSFNIFDLEMEDVQFKRQIAVQYLIVLHFLATLSIPEPPTEGGKSTPLESKSIPNKFVQYPKTLSPEHLAQVESLHVRLVRFLDATGRAGRGLWKALKTVLYYEDNWTRWKENLCNPKLACEDVEAAESMRPLKRKLEVSSALQHPNLGNAQLTRLWQASADPDGVRRAKRQRKCIPKFDDQMALLDEQLAFDGITPRDGIELEYLLTHNAYFIWTTFRAAVVEHLDAVSAFKPSATMAYVSVGSLLSQWRTEQGRDNMLSEEIKKDEDSAMSHEESHPESPALPAVDGGDDETVAAGQEGKGIRSPLREATQPPDIPDSILNSHVNAEVPLVEDDDTSQQSGRFDSSAATSVIELGSRSSNSSILVLDYPSSSAEVETDEDSTGALLVSGASEDLVAQSVEVSVSTSLAEDSGDLMDTSTEQDANIDSTTSLENSNQ